MSEDYERSLTQIDSVKLDYLSKLEDLFCYFRETPLLI